MADNNFKVKAVSYDARLGQWSGCVEFERHYDDGNKQQVVLNYRNLSAPHNASEKDVSEILLGKALEESVR